MAGTVGGVLEGSRGVKIVPDELLDSVMEDNFELICLPGGQPGTDNLIALVKRFWSAPTREKCFKYIAVVEWNRNPNPEICQKSSPRQSSRHAQNNTRWIRKWRNLHADDIYQ